MKDRDTTEARVPTEPTEAQCTQDVDWKSWEHVERAEIGNIARETKKTGADVKPRMSSSLSLDESINAAAAAAEQQLKRAQSTSSDLDVTDSIESLMKWRSQPLWEAGDSGGDTYRAAAPYHVGNIDTGEVFITSDDTIEEDVDPTELLPAPEWTEEHGVKEMTESDSNVSPFQKLTDQPVQEQPRESPRSSYKDGADVRGKTVEEVIREVSETVLGAPKKKKAPALVPVRPAKRSVAEEVIAEVQAEAAAAGGRTLPKIVIKESSPVEEAVQQKQVGKAGELEQIDEDKKKLIELVQAIEAENTRLLQTVSIVYNIK